MFINNKYTDTYYSIVNRAKTRNLSGYVEKHHIIPHSLGGSNLKENIAILTAREHFICHWLLIKMLTGKNKSKMYHALNLMLHAENSHQFRYKVTGRIYEMFKKNYAKILSAQSLKNNQMRNPEVKKKHQIAIDKRGPTVGNTGMKASKETKAKMRKAQLGKEMEELTKEKLRQINILKNKEPATILEKQRQSKLYTGTSGYHNPVTGQYKYFKINDIPADWIKGRMNKRTHSVETKEKIKQATLLRWAKHRGEV